MKTLKKSKRERRCRISMDIPDFLYQQIKINAKDRNQTLTKYVISALIAKLKLESC